MKRFLVLAVVAAMTLGGASAVYANFCAFDPVPAATILWPFVQLDYNNPIDGDTTLFAITNVSSDAVIVHVTLWSDISLALLDFNIVLSGYDVQTMNIRDILVFGDLPNTGTYWTTQNSLWNPPHYATLDYDFSKPINPIDGDWQDLGPAEDGPWSNNGEGYNPIDMPNSVGTWVFGPVPAVPDPLYVGPYCTPASDSYPDYPPIPASTLATLQFYFTYIQYLGANGALFHWDCTGGPYIADDAFYLSPDDWFQLRNLSQSTWLYITADVVQQCNKLFPDDPSYWGPAIISYDNVLIGDVMWVNTAGNFSEGDTAVMIEADFDSYSVLTWAFGVFPATFYWQFTWDLVDGFGIGSIDRREPLPTAWAFRYIGAGTTAMDTWLRVWKNYADIYPVLDEDENFYGYAASDCWAYTYYAWDEDENFITVPTDPWSAPGSSVYIPNLLPLETQEVHIDQFNTVDVSGWMMFIWPASNLVPFDLGWEDYYQTWMGVKYGAYGQFSAFMTGSVLANQNCFSDQVIQNLGINYDYIRSNGGPWNYYDTNGMDTIHP
jgi:hypothetical protein